jgi:hypothetical protein
VRSWLPKLRGETWALVAAVAFYLALALPRLSYPGLQHDELLFANAALGGIDHTFVWVKAGGVIVYLLSYVGALKAWLYAPIFRLFGVSVWTIRFPAVALSAFGLGLTFFLGRRGLGAKAAALAVLLLVSNATFLWATKVDHGPVVLEFVLEVSALAAFLEGAGPLFFAACLLGLFQKISFFFWLFGFLPAAFAFFPARRRLLLLTGAGGAAYLAAWASWMGIPFGRNVLHAGFGARLAQLSPVFLSVLDGSAFPGFLWGTRSAAPWAALLVVGILLAGAARVVARAPTPPLVKALLFQAPISLGLVLLTAPAWAYWHFFFLLPGISLVVASLCGAWGRAGTALFGVLLASQLYGEARSVARIGTPPANARFTMAIYPLIDFCRSAEAPCLSLDWGTHAQILAFVPGRAYRELSAGVDPAAYYVSYDGLQLVNHQETERFFRGAELEGWTPVLVKRIPENTPAVFNVYRMTREGAPVTSSGPGSPR